MKKFVLISFLFLGFSSLALSERPSVCPFGYDQVDRKCFKILNLALTFFEAITACDAIDGKVVEVSSKEDQATVADYLNKKQTMLNDIWLGATDLQGKWMFLSSSNKDVLDTYNAWSPGNPTAPSANPSNCAAMNGVSGWKWQNVPCSYNIGALCYVTLREGSSDSIVG